MNLALSSREHKRSSKRDPSIQSSASSPLRSSTMASVPPGDIQTQPANKIVFNAPYDDKHTYHIKITNAGGRRIGWAIKTTNMKRLGVDPPAGVLDPKEAVLMAVSCDAFAYGQEDTNNDRITIEWTNTPDGAASSSVTSGSRSAPPSSSSKLNRAGRRHGSPQEPADRVQPVKWPASSPPTTPI